MMTLRQVRQLEIALGLPLDYVDVTTHSDSEITVVVVTPRCAYCGTFNPTGHCDNCGASVLRDGDETSNPNR